MSRCLQCGAPSSDGKTCAERLYAELAGAERRSPQEVVLLAARYALAHPGTHSLPSLAIARSLVRLSAADLEGDGVG